MTTSFKANKLAIKKITEVVHEDNNARPQFVKKSMNKRVA